MGVVRIDEDAGTVTEETPDGPVTHAMDTPEAFALVSRAWLRCGWDAKYVYGFTWMGRPIIQLPDDMFRLQELVFAIDPDVVIETGIAHGGSLIFQASLARMMGHAPDKRRVIGVDIEIRPHNRAAIEAHPLFEYITMHEGSSVDPAIVDAVRAQLRPDDTVLVVLDSNHAKEHVLAELEAFGPMVSKGSYILACDGIMGQVVGAPRTQPDWTWNNPTEAAKAFVAAHPGFVLEEPAFPFNEGVVSERVTYWPGAYIKRID